jgi:hypothetical protein
MKPWISQPRQAPQTFADQPEIETPGVAQWLIAVAAFASATTLGCFLIGDVLSRLA